MIFQKIFLVTSCTKWIFLHLESHILLTGVTFTKSNNVPATYKEGGGGGGGGRNHTETFLQSPVILIVLMVGWRETDAERLQVKHGAAGQLKNQRFPQVSVL